MVDAQIYPLGIFLHRLAVAKKLDARHVHGHHKMGFEISLFKQANLHIHVARRDEVRTQNGCCFAQTFQHMAQGHGAAYCVPIRVFMAQKQNIIRPEQAADRFCQLQDLAHIFSSFYTMLAPRKARHMPPVPGVMPGRGPDSHRPSISSLICWA